FSKRFLLDLAEDWQQHGREVFRRGRRESPASYLKVCAMLVPREMQIEHSGGVKAMTTDQIEGSIEYIKEQLAKREAGANAKVVEGCGADLAGADSGQRQKSLKRSGAIWRRGSAPRNSSASEAARDHRRDADGRRQDVPCDAFRQSL